MTLKDNVRDLQETCKKLEKISRQRAGERWIAYRNQIEEISKRIKGGSLREILY